MNPDNQNLPSFNNQPTLDTNNNTNQTFSQSTRPYSGPQQFSPFSTSSSPQTMPSKNNKKFFLVVITLSVLLIFIIVLAVFMNIRSDPVATEKGLTKTYDSPIGLLASMQNSQINSGSFKLRGSYVGKGDFVREGGFGVEKGKVRFKMLTDEQRVNDFMKQIYDKQKVGKADFNPAKNGVTNTFSYDFASISGYHYLYDQAEGDLNGFIPRLETAKAESSANMLYNLTSGCDSALADVKKQTNMTTTGLKFDIVELGINKKKATINFSSMQSIDKSVQNFFSSCYNLNDPSATKLKTFVSQLKENVTKSPQFTYWQDAGASHLVVAAPSENSPFGGSLDFELKDLSQKMVNYEGSEGSYVERRNQFGLAYSLCRVDPVITRGIDEEYLFLRDDPEYAYPRNEDTGYYCTTLDTPPQYSPKNPVNLVSTTGAVSPVTGVPLSGLRGFHDLIYEIERYNLENKRYPGQNEFRDMANSNMGSLTSVTQEMFADKSLAYTGLPKECDSTCNDYVLSFIPVVNVQVQRSTYLPK